MLSLLGAATVVMAITANGSITLSGAAEKQLTPVYIFAAATRNVTFEAVSRTTDFSAPTRPLIFEAP